MPNLTNLALTEYAFYNYWDIQYGGGYCVNGVMSRQWCVG